MTISTTVSSVTLITNGVTTVWPFSFLVPYEDDGVTPGIDVWHITALGGVDKLTWPTDFTVSGVGVAAGGTVTTAAYATGGFITIARSKGITQPTAVANQEFYPHTVETLGDQITMLLQQVHALTNRALLVPPNEAGLDAPARVLRLPGYYLGFGSGGGLVAQAGNGLAGPTGAQGPAGPTGPQGPAGAGSLGYTALNKAGDTWTNGRLAFTGNPTVDTAGLLGFPPIVQNISRTLLASDSGFLLLGSNAGAFAYTIPPFASVPFPNGTVIGFCNIGAGVLTLTRNGNTLRLAGMGTNQDVAVAQWGEGTLWQQSQNVWVARGVGLS